MLQITSLEAPKFAKSVAGQIRAGKGWLRWIANTQLSDIRVWIHAPSVGEGLVAEPVMGRLTQSIEQPTTIIRTYTSPSAMNRPEGFPYDRSDFLPSPTALENMVACFRPSLIVYPRADLWPALVDSAARRNVPQVVIGGSVRPDSRRLLWPVRSITSRMVRHLNAVGVVTTEDIPVWESMGASTDRIVLTGDPRDSHVIDRIPTLNWMKTLADWTNRDFVLVAGSTHRGDEEHVLTAATRLQGRTILVPHDPTAATIQRLVRSCDRMGLNHVVISTSQSMPDTDEKLLIVNAVGVLQDLYALANVAFVGGGFDGTRVHSFSEPAALGVPILAGPGAALDPTARRFLESDGARLINDGAELADECRKWLPKSTRRIAGLRVRAVLTEGAATKTANLLQRVLDGKSPVV